MKKCIFTPNEPSRDTFIFSIYFFSRCLLWYAVPTNQLIDSFFALYLSYHTIKNVYM